MDSFAEPGAPENGPLESADNSSGQKAPATAAGQTDQAVTSPVTPAVPTTTGRGPSAGLNSQASPAPPSLGTSPQSGPLLSQAQHTGPSAPRTTGPGPIAGLKLQTGPAHPSLGTPPQSGPLFTSPLTGGRQSRRDGNNTAFISADPRHVQERAAHFKRQINAAYEDANKPPGVNPKSKRAKKQAENCAREPMIAEAKKMFNEEDVKQLSHKDPLMTRLVTQRVIDIFVSRGAAIDAVIPDMHQFDSKPRSAGSQASFGGKSDDEDFAGDDDDAAGNRPSASRARLPFPGLASIAAKIMKIGGQKNSRPHHPEPDVFAECITPLGNKFYDPIVRAVIQSSVRMYKKYIEMVRLEHSESPVDVQRFQDLMRYLQTACPALLMWKYTDASAAGREGPDHTKAPGLHRHPLNRMLLQLERTCARTTKIYQGVRDGGKTLNAKMISEAIACIEYDHDQANIQGAAQEGGAEEEGGDGEEGEQNDRTTGKKNPPPTPDRLLYAVVKAAHKAISQGLKNVTDAGRLQLLKQFVKEIGIVLYLSAGNGTKNYSVTFPGDHVVLGNDELQAEYTSGFEKVGKTKTFRQTDKHGFRTAMPGDIASLKTLMSEEDIEHNKVQLQKLAKAFPDMTCLVKTQQFVAEKTQGGFSVPMCRLIMDSVEEADAARYDGDDQDHGACTKKMPLNVKTQKKVKLHMLSLRLLLKYAQVDDTAVFLATSDKSLQAVHALALSLYGLFYSLQGKKGLEVPRVLSAHMGPLSMMYVTKQKAERIGLVGVQHLPFISKRVAKFLGMKELPSDELRVPVKDPSNGFTRGGFDIDLSCLNKEYRGFMMNASFITPAKARELVADGGTLANSLDAVVSGGADGDGSEGDERHGGSGYAGAKLTTEDDGIDTEEEDMVDTF